MDLTGAQKEQLLELIGLYVGNMADGHAKVKMEEVRQHLNDTYFAWVGGTAPESVEIEAMLMRSALTPGASEGAAHGSAPAPPSGAAGDAIAIQPPKCLPFDAKSHRVVAVGVAHHHAVPHIELNAVDALHETVGDFDLSICVEEPVDR